MLVCFKNYIKPIELKIIIIINLQNIFTKNTTTIK